MARVQASWLPDDVRGRAGGWLWLAARWGGAFSPFLFAALIRWIDTPQTRSWINLVLGMEGLSGWRLGFFFAGIVGFVWCIWFYWWYRDDPASKSAVNQSELDLIRGVTPLSPGGRGVGGEGVQHLSFQQLWPMLISNRSLLALVGFYIFGSFGWSFFVSWMPRYLNDVHHFPFDASESIWKQPLLYGGISCLLGGTLSDWLLRATGWRWLGRALFPFIGLATAATAIFCVRYVDNYDDAVLLMCISGAAFDFGQGATWASIVDIGGNYAGTAAGFINMLGNLGNAFQPVVGSWIFNHFGWDPLFIVYAGAFLLSASMWFFINPAQRFHSSLED